MNFNVWTITSVYSHCLCRHVATYTDLHSLVTCNDFCSMTHPRVIRWSAKDGTHWNAKLYCTWSSVDGTVILIWRTVVEYLAIYTNFACFLKRHSTIFRSVNFTGHLIGSSCGAHVSDGHNHLCEVRYSTFRSTQHKLRRYKVRERECGKKPDRWTCYKAKAGGRCTSR